MINEIEIQGFKSFKDVKISLGHLNLFVGMNASGKSNFFDALRAIEGIGLGFAIDEILAGKPHSATGEVWEPIRGGIAWAAFRPRGMGSDPNSVIRFRVKTCSEREPTMEYTIGFTPADGMIHDECLLKSGKPIFSIQDVDPPLGLGGKYYPPDQEPVFLDFSSSEKSKRPGLHMIMQHEKFDPRHRSIIRNFLKELTNIQWMEPAPEILKNYAAPYRVNRMGPKGENFAAVVDSILDDADRKDAYLSWLKELVPAELDDVAVLRGAIGEPLFAIKEQGMDYPAPILSDGTLRFAALVAMLFQPDMPDILAIEEIETGIHANKLRLLVELLKTQARDRQIMATTHSTLLLAWLNEEDYPTTFYCKRDDDSGASIIKPISMIPNINEIAQKYPIDDLFAEGWPESIL